LDVTPPSTNDLSLAAFYSSEVACEAEVNVILDHFETALVFLANHPHDIVGDVNLINGNEQQQLVDDFNPPGSLSTAQNISELIETQASQTPEKIAVRVSLTSLSMECSLMFHVQLQFDQDIFLTYKQMDSLSNDLAYILITRGVKQGMLVALYMDKSIEMFLSILAIHKAGGGYIPLDPEHPAERTQTVVHLAQASMVLTIKELANQLVSVLVDTSIGSLLVDFTKLTPATKPNNRPVGRDDVCHVIFTSGSTGTPKGIEFASSLSMMT
jgi:non-ribosomal peptide synthetase component F